MNEVNFNNQIIKNAILGSFWCAKYIAKREWLMHCMHNICIYNMDIKRFAYAFIQVCDFMIVYAFKRIKNRK